MAWILNTNLTLITKVKETGAYDIVDREWLEEDDLVLSIPEPKINEWIEEAFDACSSTTARDTSLPSADSDNTQEHDSNSFAEVTWPDPFRWKKS